MNSLRIISIIFLLIITISCSKHDKDGRFNYPLIKSKIDLNDAQSNHFDEITSIYTSKAKEAWVDSNGDISKAKEAQALIFKDQDNEIKKILTENQFLVYQKEVTIERKGREVHNMELIKVELNLDSIQSIQYDKINKAFFITLFENHDNYHGKLDVYIQYHEEINKSREKALKELLTEKQFKKYLDLYHTYAIGKTEM